MLIYMIKKKKLKCFQGKSSMTLLVAPIMLLPKYLSADQALSLMSGALVLLPIFYSVEDALSGIGQRTVYLRRCV